MNLNDIDQKAVIYLDSAVWIVNSYNWYFVIKRFVWPINLDTVHIRVCLNHRHYRHWSPTARRQIQWHSPIGGRCDDHTTWACEGCLWLFHTEPTLCRHSRVYECGQPSPWCVEHLHADIDKGWIFGALFMVDSVSMQPGVKESKGGPSNILHVSNDWFYLVPKWPNSNAYS